MTAAAILTGGLARRFHGLDKSGLVVEGRPILEQQLERVAPAVSGILIVTSEARAADFPTTRLPGARMVIDRYPGAGPLGAVVTALESAPGWNVLALASDMPHVSAALVAALVQLHGDDDARDATVPWSTNGAEPLCAVYAPSALAPLRRALDAGELSLRLALDTMRVRAMPVEVVARLGDPAVLFHNINRPVDLPR